MGAGGSCLTVRQSTEETTRSFRSCGATMPSIAFGAIPRTPSRSLAASPATPAPRPRRGTAAPATCARIRAATPAIPPRSIPPPNHRAEGVRPRFTLTALVLLSIAATGCGERAWACLTESRPSGPRCSCDNGPVPEGSQASCASSTCCRAFELTAAGHDACICDQKDSDRCELSLEALRQNEFARNVRRVATCPPR